MQFIRGIAKRSFYNKIPSWVIIYPWIFQHRNTAVNGKIKSSPTSESLKSLPLRVKWFWVKSLAPQKHEKSWWMDVYFPKSGNNKCYSPPQIPNFLMLYQLWSHLAQHSKIDARHRPKAEFVGKEIVKACNICVQVHIISICNISAYNIYVIYNIYIYKHHIWIIIYKHHIWIYIYIMNIYELE